MGIVEDGKMEEVLRVWGRQSRREVWEGEGGRGREEQQQVSEHGAAA